MGPTGSSSINSSSSSGSVESTVSLTAETVASRYSSKAQVKNIRVEGTKAAEQYPKKSVKSQRCVSTGNVGLGEAPQTSDTAASF